MFSWIFSLQLKTYEDDFRRETEEKSQIKTKFESKEQENERIRRENQSHTATIRHFDYIRLHSKQADSHRGVADLSPDFPLIWLTLQRGYFR